MIAANRPKSFYQPGGALPLDSPAYVRRAADEELLAYLTRGDYCSILSSRQMGKSSLIARTSAELRGAGLTTCVIDLSAMSDAAAEADKWYLALQLKIGKALKQTVPATLALWSESAWPTPAQRWTAVTEHLLVDAEAKNPRIQLVVFLDEIDATRDIPFKDSFFATIRSCFNRRPSDPIFRRLTFCLVGSARPTDLIADPNLTPFNIGRRIELADFDESEAEVLIPGMERADAEGKSLLSRVMHWTGGHPYLTHRLCMKIAENDSVCRTEDVDRLTESLFFSIDSREQDDNLAFVSHRALSSCANERELMRLLSVYEELLRGKLVRDHKSDPILSILHLAGLVRSEGGNLKVRNRIYLRVFDRAWVRENMPDAQMRMVRAAYWRAAVRWASVAAALAALSIYSIIQRQIAVRNAETATRAAHLEHVILMQAMQALWEHADLAQMEANLRSTPAPERNFEWRYWLRQTHLNLRTLADPQAAGGRVAAAVFSPDGSWLATSGKYRFIDIWDPKTGLLLRRLSEPLSPYTLSLDVSRDGTMLVSGGEGEVARVWDTASWQPVVKLDMGTTRGEVTCVRFSPDGRLVAAGMVQGTGTRVFDARSGKLLYKLETGTVWSVAFRPRVNTLAVAGDFSRISLWPLDQQISHPAVILTTVKSKSPDEDVAADCLAFSPDGRRLAAGCKDDLVRIWNVEQGQLSLTLRGSENGVSSVTFAANGTTVIAAGLDRSIRAWDARNGDPRWTIPAHTRWVNCIATSPDGLLASASDDGTAKLWYAKDPALKNLQGTPLLGIAKGVRIQGEIRMPSVTFDGRIGWLDPASGNWASTGMPRLTSGVLAFVGSDNGNSMLVIDQRGQISHWSGDESSLEVGRCLSLAALAPRVSSIALSPDATQVLVALLDGQVKRVDLQNGRVWTVLADRCAQNSDVAWAPGQHPMWAAGPIGRRTLYISDAKFESPPRRISIESSGGLYLSNDASSLVVTCVTDDPDPDPILLDLATLKRRRLVGHATACQTADFSPDDSRIVTGGSDNTVRLWDAHEGINLQTWRLAFTPTVLFAPDGNHIVAWRGKSLKIFGAANPEEVSEWTKNWR